MTAESWTNVVIVLAGCALAWGLWRAAQPRPVFTVRLVNGVPQAMESVVTPAFLERVREVAAAQQVSRGTVSGYAYGTFVRLRFSEEIPEACRQQLRNWWASFGWSAPRTCATRRCS